MPSKFTTTYTVMRSNNKARISGLAASTHASRSHFARSPFHLAVGDLGSRLVNILLGRMIKISLGHMHMGKGFSGRLRGCRQVNTVTF